MANAWLRIRHPDYDELRRILGLISNTIRISSSGVLPTPEPAHRTDCDLNRGSSLHFARRYETLKL